MDLANADPGKPAPSRGTLAGILVFSYVYPALYYLLAGQIFRDAPGVRFFATILSAILLGAVAVWGMRRDGISLEEIGFQWKRVPQALLLIAVVWVVMALAYFAIAGPAGLRWIGDPFNILQQWLFVGIGEELLYRGYLLHRLQRAFSHLKKPLANLLAIFLSSFFFSTMHIPVRLFNGFSLPDLLLSLVLIFLLAVFLSSYMLRGRNIIFNGLIHGSWNVPLLGSQGDYMLLMVALVVIEGYNLVRRALPKNPVLPAES